MTSTLFRESIQMPNVWSGVDRSSPSKQNKSAGVIKIQFFSPFFLVWSLSFYWPQGQESTFCNLNFQKRCFCETPYLVIAYIFKDQNCYVFQCGEWVMIYIISSPTPVHFFSSLYHPTPNPSFQKNSHSSWTSDILALLCFVGQYSSSCKVLQIYYRVSAKYTMTSLSPKDSLKKSNTCIIIAKYVLGGGKRNWWGKCDGHVWRKGR